MGRLLNSLSSPSSPGMARTLVLRHGRFFTNVSSSLSPRDGEKIQSTQRWFERVVMGEKLCPFAAPFLKQEGLLRIVSSNATNVEQAVQHVHHEVMELVGHHDNNTINTNNDDDKNHGVRHETTLVVLDKDSFAKEYLDFVRLSWELQERAIESMYLDKLQLVLFHPLATHQTYGDSVGSNSNNDHEYDNPADYTIRSPYPTVHLLREEDVLQAVKSGYPNLEYLPSRNKAKLTAQGIDRCRQRLQDCYVRY